MQWQKYQNICGVILQTVFVIEILGKHLKTINEFLHNMQVPQVFK